MLKDLASLVNIHCMKANPNEFRRVLLAHPGRTRRVTGKAAAPYDPPLGDSKIRPFSSIRKQPPPIAQTLKLLRAALRLWELKNGYRR
jgi:hypothetical protein